MRTFTELYDQIYLQHFKLDPKGFVTLVEDSLDINALFTNSNHEDEFKVAHLLSDYSLYLSGIGSLRKSLEFLNKSIDLFENLTLMKGKNLFKEPMYEALIWTRGLTYFKLNKYGPAKIDFKRLVDNFPDKLDYKKGYNSCKNFWLIRIHWTLLVLLGLSTCLEFFVKNKSHLTSLTLLIALITLLISSITLDVIIRKRR
jgi:tetratricopeptide (TPR) repeat protein